MDENKYWTCYQLLIPTQIIPELITVIGKLESNQCDSPATNGFVVYLSQTIPTRQTNSFIRDVQQTWSICRRHFLPFEESKRRDVIKQLSRLILVKAGFVSDVQESVRIDRKRDLESEITSDNEGLDWSETFNRNTE